MIEIYMGLDVHKRTVYITELDDDGNIMEQYEIGNNINELEQFRSRYIDLNPEIALEVSTTGKYIARKLSDMGFHVHLADLSDYPSYSSLPRRMTRRIHTCLQNY